MISPKWVFIFSPTARKSLKKLDRPTQILILKYVQDRLETEEQPPRFGKLLEGNLRDFWCYRVEDYKIICDIKDHTLEIIAIYIDHRSKVYKAAPLLFKKSV